MIQQVLSHYHLPLLACLGLLLFLAVFAGALVWVYDPRRKPLYAPLGALPLEELKPIRTAEERLSSQ